MKEFGKDKQQPQQKDRTVNAPLGGTRPDATNRPMGGAGGITQKTPATGGNVGHGNLGNKGDATGRGKL